MIQDVPPWAGRRRVEALERVKADGRRTNAPCVICRLPINYSLEYPNPMSCSVQHLKSRSSHPHLTWVPSNWAPSHLECNTSLGNREWQGLGVMSEEW